MIETKFEAGDIVWTSEGIECEYVAYHDGTHIVLPILVEEHSEDHGYHGVEYYEERYTSDKPIRTYKVFSSTPVNLHSKEIAEELARLEAVKEELLIARRELFAAKNEKTQIGLDINKLKKDYEKAASKYPPIQHALDFIEGRVTHLVEFTSTSIKIHAADEYLSYKDDYSWARSKGMKLLTLFGYKDVNSKENRYTFGVNRYYDGSGHNTFVYPATSYEDARRIVRELAEEDFAQWHKDGKSVYLSVYHFGKYMEYGVALPEKYLEESRRKDIQHIEQRVKSAAETLAAEENKLKELLNGAVLDTNEDGDYLL